MKELIGIIGGAGPLAASHMQHKLMAASAREYGARKDEQFPSIICLNYPIQGITEKGLMDESLALNDLSSRFNVLTAMNCNNAVLCCGSLHHLQTHLPSEVNILNWIEKGVHVLKQSKKTKIGVVGSFSSLSHGLYQSALEKEGLLSAHTPTAIQDQIDGLIELGMSGACEEIMSTHAQSIINFFQSEGCDAVWWACTDLFNVPSHCSSLFSINSINLMVDCILEKTMSTSKEVLA